MMPGKPLENTTTIPCAPPTKPSAAHPTRDDLELLALPSARDDFKSAVRVMRYDRGER